MGRYDGKRVIITGGSSGIGLSTARLLVAEGARVLVTGRTEASLDRAREELGERLVAVRSDAASLADVDALGERAEQELGAVDLLFLNAGVTRWTPLETVTEEQYDELFAINAKGPYFTARRFVGLLAPGSSIVLTTSVVNVMGYPLVSAYAATKAAGRSMVRSLARELLPRDVRVNAVSPGVIDTDVLEKAADRRTSEEAKARTAATNPMGRIGRPEEVARAVAFLAFEATYTTGFELPVDGGTTQL